MLGGAQTHWPHWSCVCWGQLHTQARRSKATGRTLPCSVLTWLQAWPNAQQPAPGPSPQPRAHAFPGCGAWAPPVLAGQAALGEPSRTVKALSPSPRPGRMLAHCLARPGGWGFLRLWRNSRPSGFLTPELLGQKTTSAASRAGSRTEQAVESRWGASSSSAPTPPPCKMCSMHIIFNAYERLGRRKSKLPASRFQFFPFTPSGGLSACSLHAHEAPPGAEAGAGAGPCEATS